MAQRKKIYKPPSTINVGGMKFKVVATELNALPGITSYEKLINNIVEALEGC